MAALLVLLPRVEGAIIDVASCQNYCKSVPGASHFNLRTSSPPFECHCKSCSGSQKGNIGFVSGKITCTGKMLYLLVRNPFYIMIISLSLYSINISNYHNHHHYFYHHQRGTRCVPTEVSGECKSNCTKDGYHKCFGNIGHSKSDNYHWQLKRSVFFAAPMKQVDSTLVEIDCHCGQTTVKRYTGRYCGLHRQPCTRKEKGVNDPISTLENIWVDGNNTFHHKKSNIRSFPTWP